MVPHKRVGPHILLPVQYTNKTQHMVKKNHNLSVTNEKQCGAHYRTAVEYKLSAQDTS